VAQEPPPADQPPETTEESLDTTRVVQWCISVLAANAWQGMGLIPNPATKKIERTLDDARLAIDAVAALAEHVKPRLSEPDRRQLDALLNDLRLNFLQQKDRP